MDEHRRESTAAESWQNTLKLNEVVTIKVILEKLTYKYEGKESTELTTE